MANGKKKKVIRETRVVVAPSSGVMAPRTAARRRRRRSQQNSPSTSPLVQAYLQTLSDPWECGPVKLGYDTFQDTVLSTGYLRQSFTVNSTDGSFSCYMQPSVVYMFQYNNALASAAPNYTSVSATNYASIGNQGYEARVISGGMRAMALFPQTASPGVLFVGTTTSMSRNNYATTGFCTNGLVGLPQSEMTIGTKGCRGVMLPIDNDSYTFKTVPSLGYAASDLTFSPVIYIAGLGFPVGTIIYVECILNLEQLPGGASGVGVNTNELTPGSTLSDIFPTPQQMYSGLRNLLPDAVSLDGVAGLASSVAGMAGFPGISNGINSVRSLFGQGRHLRNTMSLVSGQSERARAVESSVVIEELKEDSDPSLRRNSYHFVPSRR